VPRTSRFVSLVVLLLLSTLAVAAQSPVPPPPPAGSRQPQPPASQAPPPPVSQRPDPQMPPITFRAEVNYVEVDAVVADVQGKFVRDLRREDFTITEDGKPQEVSAFALVDIPVTRAERPLFTPGLIEPDVQNNLRTPDGRLYVLLLDDIHTDATRSMRVRRAARQFIERNLGANDLAAVLSTGGRSDGSQDFTNSQARLLEAIDKFMGHKLRSATLNKIDSYNNSRGSGLDAQWADPEQAQRLHYARNMLSTIRSLSDYLASIHGRRKAVVLISEGVDFNIWDTLSPNAAVATASDMNRRGDALFLIDETQEAIAAATRANVSLYTLDPRGLSTFGEDAIQMTALPALDQAIVTGINGLADETRAAQDSLRVLADQTGGFAAINQNDFSDTFQRIVDENSSYYVLGYYPANDKRDGRFRKIEVRLARPGLTVKARKGYVAPRGGKAAAERKVDPSAGTSNQLREALNSPLQINGLKLAVFAAPIKGPDRKAAIAIVTQLLGREIAFTQKDGKYTNALEVSYVAVDKDGKVAAGNRDTLTMSLKPDTYQRVAESGFRVQSRLELAPGKYQLRIAAREGGGKVGSIFYDLVVPDFHAQPLMMSGLVLTSSSAGGMPTAGAIAELTGVLSTPPTTSRSFSMTDEIALLAEIYDNQPSGQPHLATITTSLKAEGGRAVFSTSEQRSSKELGGGKGGFGYTVRIPLKDVAEGLYVLRVEAASTLKGVPAAVRELQIRVVR